MTSWRTVMHLNKNLNIVYVCSAILNAIVISKKATNKKIITNCSFIHNIWKSRCLFIRSCFEVQSSAPSLCRWFFTAQKYPEREKAGISHIFIFVTDYPRAINTRPFLKIKRFSHLFSFSNILPFHWLTIPQKSPWTSWQKHNPIFQTLCSTPVFQTVSLFHTTRAEACSHSCSSVE